MLDVGYYVNVFPVELQEDSARVMVTERSNFPDLRLLRQEIRDAKKDVFVYADGDKVYGYGKEVAWLSSKKFSSTIVHFRDVPRLTSRMILEGFVIKAKENGYIPLLGKGRCRIFNRDEFQKTSDNRVRVYKDFDLRSLFLKDVEVNKLVFGLVVDVTYALRNEKNNPLNFYEIIKKYGSQTLREVRKIQGDLIPTGMNREISRQRLKEDILPFVKRVSSFQLPCDVDVILKPEPLRVILGGEDEALR